MIHLESVWRVGLVERVCLYPTQGHTHAFCETLDRKHVIDRLSHGSPLKPISHVQKLPFTTQEARQRPAVLSLFQ